MGSVWLGVPELPTSLLDIRHNALVQNREFAYYLAEILTHPEWTGWYQHCTFYLPLRNRQENRHLDQPYADQMGGLFVGFLSTEVLTAFIHLASLPSLSSDSRLTLYAGRRPSSANLTTCHPRELGHQKSWAYADSVSQELQS